jgi:putative hydrolase of the HAD superfamily
MTIDVVFDFGAVLFSWRPDLLVAEQFSDRAPDPQAARALAHEIFHHDDWRSFDRGTVALDQVIARTAARLALPQPAMATLMSGIGERLTPIPDSLELLTRLRDRRDQSGDVRLYFLSNMPAPFARVLERRHDFLRWFDGGVFSGDVRLIKPEPAIYALLESRYALEPARLVFIDDLPANVAVAQARGWRGIHFRSAAQAAGDLNPTLA